MKSRIPVQAIFREYFEGVAAAVGLAIFLRLFVLSVLYLPEKNMEPGLLRGDFVVSWKLAYGLRVPFGDGKVLNAKAPEVGDVVTFRFPGDEEQLLIRRIMGRAGDTLEIKDGIVILNGKVLQQVESKGKEAMETLPSGKTIQILPNLTENFGPVTVPEGQFFVLADNRSSLDDSRAWGFVALKLIESRLSLIWLSIDNTEQRFDPRWGRIFTWVQ